MTGPLYPDILHIHRIDTHIPHRQSEILAASMNHLDTSDETKTMTSLEQINFRLQQNPRARLLEIVADLALIFINRLLARGDGGDRRTRIGERQQLRPPPLDRRATLPIPRTDPGKKRP